MLDRCYAITLNTDDLPAIRDYYHNVLMMDLLDEHPGESVTLDGGTIQVTFESFYRKPDSYCVLYFETEDVLHFCKRLRASGHDVPNEWPDKAELIDPDGRKVVVTQRL